MEQRDGEGLAPTDPDVVGQLEPRLFRDLGIRLKEVDPHGSRPSYRLEPSGYRSCST